MKDQGLENETDPTVQPADRNSKVILGDEQSQYNIKQPNKASQLAAAYMQLDDALRDEFVQLTLHPEDNPPQAQIDGWEPLTMREVYAPRPPVAYVVDGIFKKASLNIPYGAPGDMKTFLLQDCVVCVALGKDWLMPAPFMPGGQAFKVKQGQVVWVDQDMGKDETLERFQALGANYGAPEDLPIRIYTFPNPALNASDAASVAALAARSMDADMIVIDNLGNVSGGVEENSSGMIQVMANLRWLAETTGAAVVIIHHQRKSTQGGNGRAGDALRGHSSIEASVDIALHVDREPNSNSITVKSTKTRSREVAPFTAYFTYEDDGKGNLTKAAFYSIEPDDKQSNFAVEREILKILEGNPMNQASLWQAVKAELPEVGKNRIVDKIRQLENVGKLLATSGKRGQVIYSLPTFPASPTFPDLPGKVKP